MTQTLGTYVTNEQASTFSINASGLVNAPVISIIGTTELTDNANGDEEIICKLPVDAKLISAKFAFDDFGGTTATMDIGFWKANADGVFTAVDADALVNDLDIAGAAIALTEYRFSALNIDTAALPVWDLATGLSARPAYDYLYIGLETPVDTEQAGTVSFQILYTL